MKRRDMRRFWDARATENALFFVDNRLPYNDPDVERFWALGREALDFVLGRVGATLGPDDRVVEVGCGAGRITRALAARCANVRAIDISERMLATARELNADLDNVEWIQGDGTTLAPIADGSADVCYSDVVFQHIPDPQITLGYVAEMARTLRPGGWAAFQISNDPSVHRRRSLTERARASLRAGLGQGPRGQAHPAWLGSAVEIEDLRARAEASDAVLERVEGEGTQLCHVLVRKRER